MYLVFMAEIQQNDNDDARSIAIPLVFSENT